VFVADHNCARGDKNPDLLLVLVEIERVGISWNWKVSGSEHFTVKITLSEFGEVDPN
jgi:hypothetical protein